MVLPLCYVSCVGLYRLTHALRTMGLYKKESLRESKEENLSILMKMNVIGH